MQEELKEQIREVRRLAAVPMKTEEETERVEIIMLKFKEEPKVIDQAISNIITFTNWPFKLTIYDNRPNTANTSRIWNKLFSEATCRYVLMIDSDAFVPEYDGKCWLTRMMESIDETGVVIPVGDNVGGAGQKASGAKKYPAHRRNNDVWSGYCFLVDTEKVKDKFDEEFYIYGQDSAWACAHPAEMREDVFVKHLGSYSFNKNPLREADKVLARALFQKKCKK